jgi:hypothetical protein
VVIAMAADDGRRIVGGIATNRDRAPRKRKRQRRQYKGHVLRGDLVVGRGAWVVFVDAEGNATDPVWDPKLRLYANIGDTLIVLAADDIAAVRITGISQSGFRERFYIEPKQIDGAVLVMRGPAPRKKAGH